VRCVSCNKNLTDREASRKYTDWREIQNPEDRFLCLCSKCTADSEIDYVENPFVSDKEVQDEVEVQEEGEDD
jgi:formate-dependent nitrite reductase cytochrome c552 subunit